MVNGLYLRALEIQGFKSFPDKVRLTFEKPVTCIVGPNGSGKSNISDAILWVTGEQSTKALRGGKMEDVIFGGTQKRSQMGFAEVSLILDNSDGAFNMDNSEVMITRRYYRSGESEYYINRRLVRLKDITELLMDTGMGHEGYSIIGQGRIDEILSAKSTDRRDIFEEAAGISRYRHRKEESERKLQRTDENLLRVNDKIAELELQVEPLRGQAETAKKYLLLRDELRGIEISVWADSLNKLAENAEKLEESRASAAEHLERVRAEVDAFYADNEKFSEEMQAKDLEADAVRTSITEAEGRCAETDSAIAVLRANLESNVSETERVRFELSEQDDRDSGIVRQIEERQGRITEIASERERLDAETESVLKRSDELTKSAGEAAEELSTLLREENEAASSAVEKKAYLSALASALQEMDDRESTILQDAANAGERLSQIKEDAAACDKALATAKEKTASLNNVISGYRMRVDTRRKRAEESRSLHMRLTMDANALTSRINLLREMEKEYQGYSKATKTVMQESARGILRNIHGTVGGLVSADKRYAVAIETALGGRMQHVIVGTEEDGKACIELLKRRDAGRTTFWPVSTIRGSRLNEKGLEQEKGFEGLAIDLAEYDKRFDGIYSYLIGRVAVVQTLDDAIRIGRKYGHRFNIVTLDGQVINAGGSMTGGSGGKNAGILSRANELKELETRSEELTEELNAAEKAVRSAESELADAEHELTVTSEELRAAETEELRLSGDSGHYAELLSAAEAAIGSMNDERDQLRARIKQYTDDIAGARTDIADAEKKASELQSRIDDLTEGREALLAAREEIAASLSELRARSASLEAEETAVKASIAELSSIREGLSGGRAQQQEYISGLESRYESIREEIAGKERERADITDSMNHLREKLAVITDERLAIEARRTQHGRDMQDRNNLLLNLERECAGLEQKKLAAAMEEKQIVDKLWDTYELTRNDAFEMCRELEDLQAAKQRIGELRRDISKLGTPNIGAIDEFERVNTRYQYLSEQRDDIEKAKNELTDIITDITDEMRVIFEREFKRINENFQETFLELFGGGRASLELEDESDILNCGIEIKVQPPGKSLKTITLLSGGEKAFVAIAIYFAVLKIRPAPFIVMDEIESALDEANVLRFADYMRRMSDKTQMLVITHRRGTMEEADVLYGVTMQEQGVSRIINIDLDEAERTILN